MQTALESPVPECPLCERALRRIGGCHSCKTYPYHCNHCRETYWHWVGKDGRLHYSYFGNHGWQLIRFSAFAILAALAVALYRWLA